MKRILELRKLGLATMHSNALAAVGVMTFEQLLDVEVYELKAIPNLGAKGIENVLSLVASKGHKLLGQDLYEESRARKKAKRQWVGLTDEDLANCSGHEVRWALMWEKLLKEKNT
jgi:hypothetical protein